MSSDYITVSVITVTFNSSKTLSRTMESVLGQSVKPYEYIIVDGASSDNTVDIARSFEDRFAEAGIKLVIISERDEGIYDAMNKGIAISTGELVGIINSDDWYEANAVETVTKAYEREPFDLFYADLRMIMPNGNSFIKHSRDRKYATSRDWNHPTTFITGRMYDRFQYRNDTIHDDYDLILRLKKAGAVVHVENTVIADFVMNGVSHKKSFKKSCERIGIKYGIYRRNGYSPFYFFECFIVEMGKLIIG